MIDALARDWDAVMAECDDDVRRTLGELVVELADAPDDGTRVKVSQTIARLLVTALPPRHPVVLMGNRLTPAPSSPLTLRRLSMMVRMRVVEQAPWSAFDRILTTDWENARALRGRGVDPDLPELIRLGRPDGSFAVPSFQFTDDGRPREVVLRINQLLRAGDDPWGVADWWLSGNVWLHDAPVALLGRPGEERLLAAATAAVGG
jgi:hypothetical protein